MYDHKGGGWLNTLTPAQRERVYAITGPMHGRHSRDRNGVGWSVFLDRSVGTPRSIVLRRRNGAGQLLYEIEVDATP